MARLVDGDTPARISRLPFDVRIGPVLQTAFLGTVGLLVVAPLVFTVVGSFQLTRPGLPATYGLEAWSAAFSDPATFSALGNTFALAVVREAIALAVGIVFALLIARTDLPWKATLEFLFWVSFFLPGLPMAMGWILLFDPRLGLANQALQQLPFLSGPPFNIFSFWGIVWVHFTNNVGIKAVLLVPAFRNMDAALEQASRIVGVSTIATFRRIVIPIMAPAIVAVTILGFIRALESFEIEMVIGTPVKFYVYSTRIFDLVSFEPPRYAQAMALSTVFLFVLLLLIFVERMYVSRRSYHTVTGRGFSAEEIALRAWRYPVAVIMALVAVMVTVVPVVTLTAGTFMRVFGYLDLPRPWTVDNWQRVLADPLLGRSIVNTLIVGAGAALAGIVVYSLIAYVVVRRGATAGTILDIVSWLPISIPGILMGLALLWTVFSTPLLVPLYGTVYILIVAMVIKSMPLGVQLTKAVLMQVSTDLEEASRIAGGSFLATYRRILVPILMPSFVAVGLVTFMSVVREVSSVALLGSGETRTLALLMLDYARGQRFEQATVVALIMSVTVVLVALASRLFGRTAGLSRQ